MTQLWLWFAGVAWAHTGAVPTRGAYDWSNLPDAPEGAWNVWELYPSIVIGCVALFALYVALAGPLRTRWSLSPVGPTVKEWSLFTGSLLVVFFSLQGPLHEISDVYLFSGHMVQHLLITLLFPPMLIAGIPPWMWRPLVKHGWVQKVGRTITHPVAAWLISTAILYFWHVPAMYEWAMADHDVHIAEHLMFMAGAVIMWWPATSRIEEIPRLSPGWAMVYLFLLTIPMKGLGAIITVSDWVLYPYYSVQPRLFGIDPLQDQRLGGVIMWMPGGLAFWFAMGVTFFTGFYEQFANARRNTGSSSATPAGA